MWLEPECLPSKNPTNHNSGEESAPWNSSEETELEITSFASSQDGFHRATAISTCLQSTQQEGGYLGGIIKTAIEPNGTTCSAAEGGIHQDSPSRLDGSGWSVQSFGGVTSTSSQCNNDATLRPSWSGLRAIPGDPQMDLQMPPKAEPGRTDCLGNRNEMPRKEKERWFVTMDIGKTYSRENVGMSAKKKRKKRCRRSSVELGLGFGGWGPGIQSESEAERYGAAQPLGEQTSWEPESFQSGGECIVRTDDTRQQFQGLSAKQQLVSPSANRSSNTRLLSEDTNFTKPTKSVRASVAYKGSEDIYQSEEVLENRHVPQTCSEHDIPREKMNEYNGSFWAQELTYSPVDNSFLDYGFPLKESCSSTENETAIFSQTAAKKSNNVMFPVPSYDKILEPAISKQEGIQSDNAQQGKGFPAEQRLSERQSVGISTAVTDSKHRGTFLSARYVEPEGRTLHVPQAGETPLGQKQADDVLESSREHSHQSQRQTFSFHTETEDALGLPPSLSAPDHAQAPTAVNKNVCLVVTESLGSLLPQGQQGTTEDACLDSTTALPGTSDLKYLNEITTETDHNGLHVICRNCAASDSGRKRENRGGVEQLMNAEKLTRAGSVPNLDTEKNVEAMQPPLFDSEDEGPAVDPDSGIGSTESCASQEPLTLDPTHPVYALSPFWDEMEKLTINDILHLRLVGHAQPPKELPRNAVADTSDAADSDYFTQPDESKPNRSSSEFSTLSDFEEEFSQALNTSTNPSPEPQAHGSARPPSSRATSWESEGAFITGNREGFGEERSCSDYSSQSHLSGSCVAEQCSLHPVHSQREESCLYFLSHQVSEQKPGSEPAELMEKNTKISPPFLDSKALTANFNIPSTEIIGNSVHGNEATVSPLGTSSVACFTHEDAEKLSVPEMYDCFFSDFETGSFFFPLARRCNKNKTVPIFCFSRSARQSLVFTKMWHYCLPGKSSFRPDDEDDREPIRAATRVGESVGEPTGAACAPDTYEQFCTDSDWRGDLFWRNPLSLRWTCFLGGGLSRPHGSFISWQSLAFKGRGSSLFSRSTSQGDQECLPCTDHLETRMFAQSAERTRANPRLQAALCIPGKGSLLPSLQHADLCLVCIAFASWVLKSINPQDADTWKTVLLANMSAVSAIRYLRQSSSDSAPHHEPRPTYEP
ncbi:uncharacterized protein LOC114909170 isoform X2 [Scleropages formosus]|uniref:uncharacterized protein LOC114909170 isoform X2 n=1 Tax=Scleropages formosus TaxID=113540 RepID=UPI0010FA7074|nr:uncharacterized protein LOC114909170 isoform X2 [Scleropages formosus]